MQRRRPASGACGGVRLPTRPTVGRNPIPSAPSNPERHTGAAPALTPARHCRPAQGFTRPHVSAPQAQAGRSQPGPDALAKGSEVCVCTHLQVGVLLVQPARALAEVGHLGGHQRGGHVLCGVVGLSPLVPAPGGSGGRCRGTRRRLRRCVRRRLRRLERDAAAVGAAAAAAAAAAQRRQRRRRHACMCRAGLHRRQADRTHPWMHGHTCKQEERTGSSGRRRRPGRRRTGSRAAAGGAALRRCIDGSVAPMSVERRRGGRGGGRGRRV